MAIDLVEFDRRMALQNAEFAAVSALADHYARIVLTPVVDDDYPEVRDGYEAAMRDLVEKIRANGRIL